MMSVMTAQPHLPFALAPDSLRVGEAVELIETLEGGQVFVHGNLLFVWDAGDAPARRFAAVKLVDVKAALVSEIAQAFGISQATLWNWGQALDRHGITALVPEKKGPKRNSKLTDETLRRIRELKTTGASNVFIGKQLGISEFSVRRALALGATQADISPDPGTEPKQNKQDHHDSADSTPALPALPVLPVLAARTTERTAASLGGDTQAAPRFEPAARVPYAGLFLALPSLETTGLLACAHRILADHLSPGFYGLNTLMLEAVLRSLSGRPRVEGAKLLDPEGFGRILGMDRAPEVKTIRRRHKDIAATNRISELFSAMAQEHFTRHHSDDDAAAVILYVDGHTRAYEGGKKIGKLHSTRLKFPVPATEETWVSDANGDPVMMVMAEPGASLAKELRRILPELRTAIGDERRVLVGFDRGGWSPALFAHMDQAGFDVLTWRKGTTTDIEENAFTTLEYQNREGKTYQWDAVADTTVDLVVSKTTGQVLSMRQISRIVPKTKGAGTRQIHILTTIAEERMSAGEVIYRMGARWRQENYFRFARQHFALDAHPCYDSTDDDPGRSVPNPAKHQAHQALVAARTHRDAVNAQTDAALLAINTPPAGGGPVLISNELLNEVNAPLNAAHEAVLEAEDQHNWLPTRVPLGQLHPGQQVLETAVKQLGHLFGITAYNVSMALAREVRTNTGYNRADDEAHTLVRRVLTHTGDIDPTVPGYLTITLDPMPTKHETATVAELCKSLSATQTRYPGTDLILRYAIKDRR